MSLTVSQTQARGMRRDYDSSTVGGTARITAARRWKLRRSTGCRGSNARCSFAPRPTDDCQQRMRAADTAAAKAAHGGIAEEMARYGVR